MVKVRVRVGAKVRVRVRDAVCLAVACARDVPKHVDDTLLDDLVRV